MLKLKNVYKSFDQKSVLAGASLEIDGETVALMGESGSGKTTVLRILASLEAADGGEATASGKTAVVFAEPRLFENADVLENVVCVMSGDEPKTEKTRRAEEILASLGLCDALRSKPTELSSGMAARVAIARALAYDADNYLLDEPFGALDEKTKTTAEEYVLKALSGKSVLLITHSEDEAALCDGVLLLENGKITEKASV